MPFTCMGQDKKRNPLLRKKLNRKQLIDFFATLHTCTVLVEACAGAHHMARKLVSLGHQVKLISPQFVRPFVKSNKNDFVDAEAICEAASRPAMRFVTPKTESQPVLSALHRVRESRMRDRTKTVNQIHAFLLEFGHSLPVGKSAITRLPAILAEHSFPPNLIAIMNDRTLTLDT
jgi:transposase